MGMGFVVHGMVVYTADNDVDVLAPEIIGQLLDEAFQACGVDLALRKSCVALPLVPAEGHACDRLPLDCSIHLFHEPVVQIPGGCRFLSAGGDPFLVEIRAAIDIAETDIRATADENPEMAFLVDGERAVVVWVVDRAAVANNDRPGDFSRGVVVVKIIAGSDLGGSDYDNDNETEGDENGLFLTG